LGNGVLLRSANDAELRTIFARPSPGSNGDGIRPCGPVGCEGTQPLRTTKAIPPVGRDQPFGLAAYGDGTGRTRGAASPNGNGNDRATATATATATADDERQPGGQTAFSA